jgi:hypothetical protein
MIKFWDMDNVNLLTSIDAEGGLPVKFWWSFLVKSVWLSPYDVQSSGKQKKPKSPRDPVSESCVYPEQLRCYIYVAI